MPRPSRAHEVVALLTAEGGVLRGAEVAAAVSRQALRAAVAKGLVDRLGPDLYGLPLARHFASPPSRSWAAWDDGPSDEEERHLRRRRELAKSLHGALALRSAAQHHGWMILREPPTTEVAIPESARLPGRRDVTSYRRALTREELVEGVTGHARTVRDCAAVLPFVEALAVADSALRAKDVGPSEMRRLGEVSRGPGAGRVRRVCAAANGEAENPFESALRAVSLDVPELTLVPQVEVEEGGHVARVDLADADLRIIVEADGQKFHTGDRWDEDCRRYTWQSASGWLVCRFTWKDVTARPDWVRSMLQSAVITRTIDEDDEDGDANKSTTRSEEGAPAPGQ